MSSTLAGGFLTTEPLGKSSEYPFLMGYVPVNFLFIFFACLIFLLSFNTLIYLFLIVLDLCCCEGFSLVVTLKLQCAGFPL